jgi:selenide,water dikinase
VFSSLQPQNVRLRRAIRNLDEISGEADFPLLFDPQTAGGLLASVPASAAEACVAELAAAGYRHATRIGGVTARSDALAPILIQLPPIEMPRPATEPNCSSNIQRETPRAHESV